MGKIATEQEAYNIGGTKDGLFVANKCCTKERAEIMGCDVSGDYDSNKLVEIEDLTKHVNYVNIPILFSVYVTHNNTGGIGPSIDNVKIGFGSGSPSITGDVNLIEDVWNAGIMDVMGSPFIRTGVALCRINAANNYMTNSPNSITFYRTNNWNISTGWSINSSRFGLSRIKASVFYNTYEDFNMPDMGSGIRNAEIPSSSNFSQFGIDISTYLNYTPPYEDWYTNGMVNCIKLVLDLNRLF